MGQTYVYNSGEPVAPKEGELHIEVGLFFDGTLNNLKNTELRQKYKDGKNKINEKYNTITSLISVFYRNLLSRE